MNLQDFLLDRRTAHVTRWHHRPCLMQESIATHQALTARIAYFVTELGNQHQVFDGVTLSSTRIALAALFHDEAEIVTGDIPGDQKQEHQALRDVMEEREAKAVSGLVLQAPEPLQHDYMSALCGAGLFEEGHQILKYADDLAALAFLEDEWQMGNRQPSVRETLAAIRLTVKGRSWPWLKALRMVEKLP